MPNWPTHNGTTDGYVWFLSYNPKESPIYKENPNLPGVKPWPWEGRPWIASYTTVVEYKKDMASGKGMHYTTGTFETEPEARAWLRDRIAKRL